MTAQMLKASIAAVALPKIPNSSAPPPRFELGVTAELIEHYPKQDASGKTKASQVFQQIP